jgi:hypothetical protein
VLEKYANNNAYVKFFSISAPPRERMEVRETYEFTLSPTLSPRREREKMGTLLFFWINPTPLDRRGRSRALFLPPDGGVEEMGDFSG